MKKVCEIVSNSKKFDRLVYTTKRKTHDEVFSHKKFIRERTEIFETHCRPLLCAYEELLKSL